MWKAKLCVAVFWILFVTGVFYFDAHLYDLLGLEDPHQYDMEAVHLLDRG